MYYQRSRRGRNNRDDSRSRRTQSVDVTEKIRAEKGVEKGPEKRLSNAEIDQVLLDIRSRSSSRPPPPKGTPPPLPKEFENPKATPTKFKAKLDDKDKTNLKNEEIEASSLPFGSATTCDSESDNSGSNSTCLWTENPAYCAPPSAEVRYDSENLYDYGNLDFHYHMGHRNT